MHQALTIDLICINIFKYLNYIDLLNQKTICSLWNCIIDGYDLFYQTEHLWKSYAADFKNISVICQNTSKFNNLNCCFSGLRLCLKYIGKQVQLIIQHSLVPGYQTTKTFALQDKIYRGPYKIAPKMMLTLPSLFSDDKKTHRCIYFEIHHDENLDTFLPILIDYTDIKNIRFHELQRHALKEDYKSILCSFFFKEYSIFSEIDNLSVIQANHKFFFIHIEKLWSHLRIHHLISSPYYLSQIEKYNAIHCLKYGISFETDTQQLLIYDISHEIPSDEHMKIQREKMYHNDYFSYYIVSIDLSVNHFIVLFGLNDFDNHHLYKFCYLMVDVKEKRYSFFKRNESISFLYQSYVRSLSSNLVKVYNFDGNVATLDLTNLCEVK